MKLGLSLETALHQSLTPQQIQYLKMLQLSTLQFEQHVQHELENNPMLEEPHDDADDLSSAPDDGAPVSEDVLTAQPSTMLERERIGAPDGGDGDYDSGEPTAENFNPEDAFEFYKLLWGEDPSAAKGSDNIRDMDEEDDEDFQFRSTPTFEEDLLEQLRYQALKPEERLLGEYLIGNVDDDGYLRRPLPKVVDELNGLIAEHNLAVQAPSLLGMRNTGYESGRIEGIDDVLSPVSMAQAEHILLKVQSLDPPGFASRTVQECLVAQLRALPRLNAAQKLALLVLTQAYEAFSMKHFNIIEKQLGITSSYLKEAVEVIRSLTPRPGGGTIGPDVNTVVPDFTVERDRENDDFLITVNDSRLPVLRVSNAYERLKKEARFHKFNKETREWMRKKYEDAKFLLQAIRQRKATMLRVMTAIVGLQTEFYKEGPHCLKPLIYRDVAEITSLDISTICRIVNGKYVLTDFGTFELKYFFSESLTTDDGEEVSTRIIKAKIKEMIDEESKSKPLSDDKLAKDLKTLGYNVARRTVAKYREQLRIPVARLRRDL